MQKLTREDLMSLEEYSERRPQFRAEMRDYKKNRVVPVGPNATLHFEDRRTMHYQVQEMLHAERIFDRAGIEEELETYNPLIPDGSNWKATFMMEFEDPEERRQRLAELVGVEDRVWVRVNGYDRVWAIADEDLERETEEKTSSVHFLRFELTPEMVAAAQAGAPISVGIEHPRYSHQVDPLPEAVRAALVKDLD